MMFADGGVEEERGSLLEEDFLKVGASMALVLIGKEAKRNPNEEATPLKQVS
jgi:hypothetical protein